MRKTMAMLALGFTISVNATTNDWSYASITNMWYEGPNRSNVLVAANSRLAANSNDVVGLVLKTTWHMSYGGVDEFTNTALKAAAQCATITNAVVRENYSIFTNDLQVIIKSIEMHDGPVFTEDELRKADLPHKIFDLDYLLNALNEAGKF